ncbi:hypothetical protein FHS56_001228 [Thermonema lapsum]|uniref:Uncharacterized protein n=1 Tax=Thermonema lapsum TaxID=28195 RepID=A0A846MQH9_9BACT|nr:hypothetical protein [Thermonema lapsum]NIK73715.1 hypothetical protein [Thermonema lapsum]
MGQRIEVCLAAAEALPQEKDLAHALVHWASGQLNSLQQLQQLIEKAGLMLYASVLFRQAALLFLALLQEHQQNGVIEEQIGTKFTAYPIPSMLESIKALKELEVFIEERQGKVKEVWEEVQQYIRAFYGNEK